MGERFLKSLEGLEVAAIAGLNDFFHAVVAGDANGVGGAHQGEVRLVVSDFLPEGDPVLGGCLFLSKRDRSSLFGFT